LASSWLPCSSPCPLSESLGSSPSVLLGSSVLRSVRFLFRFPSLGVSSVTLFSFPFLFGVCFLLLFGPVTVFFLSFASLGLSDSFFGSPWLRYEMLRLLLSLLVSRMESSPFLLCLLDGLSPPLFLDVIFRFLRYASFPSSVFGVWSDGILLVFLFGYGIGIPLGYRVFFSSPSCLLFGRSLSSSPLSSFGCAGFSSPSSLSFLVRRFGWTVRFLVLFGVYGMGSSYVGRSFLLFLYDLGFLGDLRSSSCASFGVSVYGRCASYGLSLW
jgi:hypothetical protein